MINNESNVNYDMQQLINITGQTAMNINNMSRQLGVVASAVDSIRTDVDGLTDRMNNLEQKEEVTTEQAATINRVIRKRIGDILGNNEEDLAKYRRIFLQVCIGMQEDVQVWGTHIRLRRKRIIKEF